jgi:kynureninase
VTEADALGRDAAAEAAARDAGAEAAARDVADPLSALRDRFLIPDGPDGRPATYLAGQSLGLQPRATRAVVEAELDRWARHGVDAWFERDRPWFTYDDTLRAPMGRIVGARPAEIAIANTLTIDLHLLLVSFFRPNGGRRRILVDGPLFPSDRHAVISHLAARGLDPAADLIVVEPPGGEATLRPAHLEAAILDRGPELATVLLSGVNFATGQAFDVARLTDAAHRAGAVALWDLAHAAGNVELELHDWGVDAAAWCTYKYLNGGPGSIAAMFVHERHHDDPSVPRLAGWWGTAADHRFAIDAAFAADAGAAGWKVSTPPMLSLVPLSASLAIFDAVGMPALRARSIALTGYLASLLDGCGLEVVTPGDPASRGAQLSVRLGSAPIAAATLEHLARAGVMADFREPDIIRLAPVPLYNTYADCWRAAAILRGAVSIPSRD